MTNAEALAVLQTDRAALFETPLARGQRHRVTVGRVVPHDLLVVRVPDPRPRGLFPGASDVRVSVPDGDRLLSFTCGVLSCTYVHGAILAVLRWPSRAEWLPGREAPRADIALPMRFRSRAGSAQRGWSRSQTIDVSSTGLRFASPADLGAGERLEIEIGLGTESIVAGAAVAWQQRLPQEAPAFVAGARFEALPDPGRRRLEALVAEQLARAA